MKTAAKIATLALGLALAIPASAEVWTLDQCIDYAVANNLTVKQRKLSEDMAEQQVESARSGYLPTLSAGASQSWNLGRGLTAENTYANRNTSSFSWNGSLNVPIFNGMRTTRQVAYAKANLQQVTEQYEAAKEDITINVITAYLQVLYSRELEQVQLEQVALSRHELERQEALLAAGKIPEVDVLEAKSQLAADELNAVQAHNDNVMARIDLAQLLQLRVEADDFDVAPLTEEQAMIMPAAEAYSRALQYNHTIQAARKGIGAAERNYDLAKSGYLPTLSFNAGLGSSYYKLSGIPGESFGAQMRHNYSTYFGLSLNIPIFDGFSTRNSMRQAKLQRQTAQLELDQAEQQLFRTIQNAYYQAVSSQQKLDASIVAEQAALTAFDSMREKYNIGRATPTEYEQSKTRALKATADRIQANYELLLRTRLLTFYSTPH